MEDTPKRISSFPPLPFHYPKEPQQPFGRSTPRLLRPTTLSPFFSFLPPPPSACGSTTDPSPSSFQPRHVPCTVVHSHTYERCTRLVCLSVSVRLSRFPRPLLFCAFQFGRRKGEGGGRGDSKRFWERVEGGEGEYVRQESLFNFVSLFVSLCPSVAVVSL